MTDLLINSRQDSYPLREMLQLLVRKFGLLQKEGAQCCGISVIQSHILYEIRRLDNPSLNEIAKTLGLDNSTLSRHVQALVKEGLIQRTQSNSDRRYIQLSLTPQGKVFEQQITEQMNCYMEDILLHVPEEKRESVMENILVLLSAMRESDCCL